jgi:hypothetical protein|nr:MAG TPA: virion morphogenesis protein [Caudoviricetes sp.]
MKVKIKSSDGLKKLSQSAKALKMEARAGVKAGSTNDETYKKVSDYGRMLEYGTAQMPARPFLRQTVAECKSNWNEQIKYGLKARGIDKAYQVLVGTASLMMKDIRATIRKGNFEPLARPTIEAKKQKGRPEPTAPLIDSTSLIQSIGSEVRK